MPVRKYMPGVFERKAIKTNKFCTPIVVHYASDRPRTKHIHSTNLL